MNEEWNQWIPIQNLAPKYSINTIHDSDKEFYVLLSDVYAATSCIKIIFPNFVHAYNASDETYRIKLIQDLDKKYGGNFYGDWTFFKVKKSLYLQWLSKESYGISDDRNLIHFSILAENMVLDLIAPSEPKFIFLKENMPI